MIPLGYNEIFSRKFHRIPLGTVPSFPFPTDLIKAKQLLRVQ